jgi:uncharacterized protein YndB with AHSA1/START domain
VNASCRQSGPDSITVIREYRVPPEQVWEAWTNPELVAQWFGSPGYTLESIDMDLRRGGRFEKRFRTDEGERFVVSGEYQEVAPVTRLVYTWNSNRAEFGVADSVVTLELEAIEQGTRLTLRHEGLTGEPVMRKHEIGWTRNLDQLAPFVERNSDNGGIGHESS